MLGCSAAHGGCDGGERRQVPRCTLCPVIQLVVGAPHIAGISACEWSWGQLNLRGCGTNGQQPPWWGGPICLAVDDWEGCVSTHTVVVGTEGKDLGTQRAKVYGTMPLFHDSVSE